MTGLATRLAVSVVAAGVGLVLAAVAWAGSPIVHRVSVGVPDFCGAVPAQDPGCNANFSLEAKQFANGTVTGQFGHGNGGFHARIDCLSVSGNTAWISYSYAPWTINCNTHPALPLYAVPKGQVKVG